MASPRKASQRKGGMKKSYSSSDSSVEKCVIWIIEGVTIWTIVAIPPTIRFDFLIDTVMPIINLAFSISYGGMERHIADIRRH